MDTPEIHAHARHTGHRLIDYALAGSAFFVSLISLWLGIEHGRTMEKLVAANSWPYVDSGINFGSGKEGKIALQIQFTNRGIGPAVVRSIEMFDGARVIRDFDGLVRVVQRAMPGSTGKMGASNLSGAVISRDGHLDLFVYAPNNMTGTQVASAIPRISTLESRICYCSVFDECFVNDSRIKAVAPVRVKTCPVRAAPFDDDFSHSRLLATPEDALIADEPKRTA